jgi:Uma2 family endonuclease
LVELGYFDDAAVELLEGALVAMSPEGPRHRWVIDLLAEHLTRTPAESYLVRAAGPWAAGESSEPEPDIAVVPRGRYHQDHPTSAEFADLLAC